MGRLTAKLFHRFRGWERSSRIAFLLAVGLLILTFFVLLFGPLNLRQPALIGFFGLIVMLQIIFMWSNRHMVTPYTLAQRDYLAEDFDAARSRLEALYAAGKIDVKSLTLLGNTYRQLALLDKSEEVLTKAVALRPFDHFPLYGFGRTLLVKGMYTAAVPVLEKALEAGAPSIVRFDLAEAQYRDGAFDAARAALETVKMVAQEPHRVLMTDYFLYQLGAAPAPAVSMVNVGLPYWREQANRYRRTPYGQSLAADVQQLQMLIEER
jgi:tetratricopeptide (TPR) repeat protein